MMASFAFLEGFASASALIAAILALMALAANRTHYAVMHYLGQCDVAMRLAPWQQWAAVAKTQLANHKHYFASDYYAKADYLAHYSPRMRRLILKQRDA